MSTRLTQNFNDKAAALTIQLWQVRFRYLTHPIQVTEGTQMDRRVPNLVEEEHY